jgi:hypothetical protein
MEVSCTEESIQGSEKQSGLYEVTQQEMEEVGFKPTSVLHHFQRLS